MRGAIITYSQISSFIVWLAVFISVLSLSPWFVWNSPITIVVSCLFLIYGLFILFKRKITKKINFFIIIFLCFTFWNCQFFRIEIKDSLSKLLFSCIPIIIIVLFSKEEKKIYINRLTTIFSFILLISLLFFLLFILGIQLPKSYLLNSNPVYGYFENYYFFIVGVDLGIFTRFQSIITEPGHLGMACSLLLYINSYTLTDWRNVVMTIALLWSFSFAGYLLYICGFITYKLMLSKNLIKSFILTLSIFSIVTTGCYVYYIHNSENIVSFYFFKRIEETIDGNKGLESTNRNSSSFNLYYERFSNKSDYWTGINSTNAKALFYGTPNSSYKNSIIEIGLIGLSLLFLICTLYLYIFPSKKGLGFLLLISISYIQRPYFMWPIECYTYFCALPIFTIIKKYDE